MSQPRNMARVYRYMKLDDLLELQSRKRVMLARVEKSYGWLDKQEAKRIRFNLHQIEVELACRAAQGKLL